jgi:two-component system, OmpR family, sensor histidine kinase RstB
VGLGAFFLALGLLSAFVVSLSNVVRYQHYWSDIVAPGMHYLSENQSLLSSASVNSFSVISQDQERLNDIVRARLQMGQVVLENEDRLFRAYVSIGTDLVLELESDHSGRSIYEVYIWLVQEALVGSRGFDEVGPIAEKFNLSLNRVSVLDELQSQWVLDTLAEDGRYLAISDDSVVAFLRSSGGEVYRLDFPKPYTAFSWPVLLLLFASGFAALFGFVFLMIQSYERKLRNVEAVADRITRGELDARVKGSSGSEALERLGNAFNHMADHIQRLMYVQKEMIHAVSHELRTPVARIRFGVQMIEDCPSPEAMRKQITGIDSDIQELDELIDEILTYARLEQGGPILAFQVTDLLQLVQQVVEEQGSVKPDLSIIANYSKDSEQWRDTEVEARYIHRSIQNLVGNATRYAQSKVKVSCFCDQETCRVDVEDDGPGIPEDQWESVFTPFSRLDDSRTRSSGGYGLGLSIVRRILYWHGGQAFLGRSEELGGAKFSLVWPRNQQALGDTAHQ